jgi:polyhydroxyalkanoate synthesis regulator phasin
MKRGWKIAGIAALVAILGVAAVGAVAYAQDAEDGSVSAFDFASKFKEALAGVLGISVDDYDAAVEKAQQQVVDEAVADGWLTEEQAELLAWRMAQAPDKGMHGMGKGMGMFGRGMGPMGGEENLLSIAADKLGMKLTELLTELQGGKSIADVAKEKGVDTQTIVDAYVAQAKENLDEAVADGNITQKQADYQLEQIKTRVTDQLDNTGMEFGPRGGGRHGGEMMGGPEMGGF